MDIIDKTENGSSMICFKSSAILKHKDNLVNLKTFQKYFSQKF